MNKLSKEVGIAFEWYEVLSIAHGLINCVTLLTTATMQNVKYSLFTTNRCTWILAKPYNILRATVSGSDCMNVRISRKLIITYSLPFAFNSIDLRPHCY